LAIIWLVLASAAIGDPGDTCWVDGDVNGDGIPLTVGGDLVFLYQHIYEGGPAPDPLYRGDLNGDGYLDANDLDMLNLIILYGIGVAPRWPVPTTCTPDIIRGGCFMDDSCAILSPVNCMIEGGLYLGDETPCVWEEICWVDMDINGDGIPMTVYDYVYLIRYIINDLGEDPPPDPLYRADINTDGFIDAGDAETYDSLFWSGPGIPEEWPKSWPTICDPSTIRGGCWLGDSCSVRSPANCLARGGVYLGDNTFCACDCSNHCDLNDDGVINPVDAVIAVATVYRDFDQRTFHYFCPAENGDWNLDGAFNPVDIIYFVNFVYRGWDGSPVDGCE